MTENPRPRGLPAIEHARENRGKIRWPSTKFWGWAAIVLAAMGIFHWKSEQSRVEGERQALLARQRAVSVELGPRWFPLREKIEAWTMELSASAGAEVIEKDELQNLKFREEAGIYLRMPVSRAKDAEAIRTGAKDSLRDAFTACLMRVPNADPFAGPVCRRTRDCAQGQVCNEVDHCAAPSQPYNLRVAYRSLRVLSDGWVRDTENAENDISLRMLKESFDDTVADDLPVAIDLLTRAKYFLLVLDEAEYTAVDGGAEGIDPSPHTARVSLHRVSDGKLLLRLARDASAVLVGAAPITDQRVDDARQRQANACALALEVRTAMGDTSAAAMPTP